MSETETAGRRTGRPRDAAIDERILDAAIIEYGKLGWSGFTMEGVARATGVSKATMYLRWSDKDQLLQAALQHHIRDLSEIDTGSVRGDLIAIATWFYDLRSGVAGAAVRRLDSERSLHEAIESRLEESQRAQVHASRVAVRRGVDRGELRRDTNVSLLLECLLGGVAIHLLAAPPALRPSLPPRDAWVQQLVDYLLGPWAAAAEPVN